MTIRRCLFVIYILLQFERSYSLESPATAIDPDAVRGRRDVIEEEKFYNARNDHENNEDLDAITPWIPGRLLPDDNVKTSIDSKPKEVPPLPHTTERVTDKPTGRGARASNENWIKLPFPGREEDDRDNRDRYIAPPQPSGALISSRMPRVNFVTQNKQLQTSETRNDQDFVRKSLKQSGLRTEFVRPDEVEKPIKPIYPRQALYYPEENRPLFMDERFYPVDDVYRGNPYNLYESRRYFGPRLERYDDSYDNYISRKPKRIIYYANLPEVMRAPPSVDLRYRYSTDPYRRYEDDYFSRSGRYDHRYWNPYYFRKEDRIYRDLAGVNVNNKDRKPDIKVPVTPVQHKEEKHKINENRNVNKMINSHQYHETDNKYNDQLTHSAFKDVVRPQDTFIRFDEPLFEEALDNPFKRKY